MSVRTHPALTWAPALEATKESDLHGSSGTQPKDPGGAIQPWDPLDAFLEEFRRKRTEHHFKEAPANPDPSTTPPQTPRL
ncbi:hypothetical protein LINPERPRIM_LOCUS20484, partial [Linum perenne]